MTSLCLLRDPGGHVGHALSFPPLATQIIHLIYEVQEETKKGTAANISSLAATDEVLTDGSFFFNLEKIYGRFLSSFHVFKIKVSLPNLKTSKMFRGVGMSAVHTLVGLLYRFFFLLTLSIPNCHEIL